MTCPKDKQHNIELKVNGKIDSKIIFFNIKNFLKFRCGASTTQGRNWNEFKFYRQTAEYPIRNWNVFYEIFIRILNFLVVVLVKKENLSVFFLLKLFNSFKLERF